jgi:Domain of Unknown Function (DUF326)
MFTADEMLRTTPGRELTNERALTDCIEACFACAQSCTACADACLDEESVAALRRCIRLNLDCAGLCTVTGEVLSRRVDPHSELLRRQVELLADASAACGEECARHGDEHPHCRVCAEACRRCEGACRALLGELATEAPSLH